MLGSIRLDGVTSCLVIEGATDSDVFREYVRQVLGPPCGPGGHRHLRQPRPPTATPQPKNSRSPRSQAGLPAGL
ncbi:MAG: hypothetical protein WDO13_15935 [Verrucomicrobiota bacterium]